MNREAYEELYREAWIKQNKIDRENNKKLREPAVDYQQARKNGLKGGRPSQPPEKNNKPLTDKAAVVNRMLLRGMKVREIGQILGISHQSVSHMKKNYGLPRHEIRIDQ